MINYRGFLLGAFSSRDGSDRIASFEAGLDVGKLVDAGGRWVFTLVRRTFEPH